MALLLVHRRYSGEPVGVWDEAGQSYYMPGEDYMQEEGAASVHARGSFLPWDAFVEKQAGTVNFQEWWSALVTDRPLDQALEDARTAFFTATSADTPTDK